MRVHILALLPAIIVVSFSGCGSPSPHQGIRPHVMQGGVDLATNVDADPSSARYPFWIQTQEFPEGSVLHDALRLVTWPDEEPVRGTWVEDRQPTGHLILRFEAASTLEERWYALQVRFDPAWRLGFTAPAHTTPDSPWTSIRSRVGSQPIITLDGAPRDPRYPDLPLGTFFLTPSEIVEFDEEIDLLDHVEYRVNGELGRCWGPTRTTVGPGSEMPFGQIELACDPADPDADIVFSIRDSFRSRQGRFFARDGVSPPTWRFRAGDGASNEPLDALFVTTHTAEVAP